ncbi:MAG TPA: apolipoprotein N-acyltransferase, partial [Bacteroidia bacterium]
MNFSPLKLFTLSLLSSLLLFAAWPASGIAPLIFIAWVPLLMVEQHFFLSWKRSKEESANTDGLQIVKKTNLKVFGYAYLAFVAWNIATTWWIWNSTGGGAAMAILANALIMAGTFLFFHVTKKRLNGRFSGVILIAYWLTFEYIHMHWDLSWTWLTLGNVFSTYFNMVQWYEYTGVFGGSLWVLAVNILLLKIVMDLSGEKKIMNPLHIAATVLVLLLPLGLSFLIHPSAGAISKMRTANVVVVQPNIDPYNEKFSGNYQEQLEKMLHLASTQADSSTDLIAFPETAIQEGMWEDQVRSSNSVETLL